MNAVDKPLAELARKTPGATAVLLDHQLNFCCGGEQSLRDAAVEKGLNADEIAAELAQLSFKDGATDATKMARPELIEHILTRSRDLHRQQMPDLIRLASRVELVHAEHPLCPAGLARHLVQMQRELEEHMRKEEQILFPMLARGMTRAAKQPVRVMRRDHEMHGRAIDEMVRLSRLVEAPADACSTWRALHSGVKALKKDLMEHIHLENNVLFYGAESTIDPAA